MKRLIGFAVFTTATSLAFGQTVLYDKMSNSTNTIITSSWLTPDGTDYDTYTWDDFTFSNESTINEVWWRGGNSTTPMGGITGFTIRFYESIAAGTQPKITQRPESETSIDYLKGYSITGTANETAVPGTSLYEYHATLSTPLTLNANTKYWVKIVADMTVLPFWGMARSTSPIGDNSCFRFFTGGAYFTHWTGDTAFQLRGSTTVPEPSAVAGISVGLVALVRRRRRR